MKKILILLTITVSLWAELPNKFFTGDTLSAEKFNQNFSYLDSIIAAKVVDAQKNAVPKGTIIASMNAPLGDGYMTADKIWYVCASKGTVGDVTVPDLRGQFLRGLDTSGEIDKDGSGRTVGEGQGASTALPSSNFTIEDGGDHAHTVTGTAASNGDHEHGPGRENSKFALQESAAGSNFSVNANPTSGFVPSSVTSTAGAHTHTVSGTAASNGTHTHTISGGDSETRPTNVAVYYYIKVQ